jgi:hypothetical protein
LGTLVCWKQRVSFGHCEAGGEFEH